MHFGNEVVDSEKLDVPGEHKVNERELKVAEQLIGSLATDFNPAKYHDEYNDCVVAMIEKKAHGQKIVKHPQIESKPVKAHDLMAALEASLAEARSNARGSAKSNGHGRRRKSA
jgi:DNA end-binding protein Ku